MRKRHVSVIAGCDTQWRGSSRQWLASKLAPWHVHKFIDVLWVTGERQRALAGALGYHGERCWDGYYACDWNAFALPQQDGSATNAPHFLYVGRYVPEKGLDILVKAYQRYRETVTNPWPLVCAGAGPLQQTLIDVGAKDHGFVQPTELPELMHKAAAFVLPSRFEPWGVVAHEAATSGLPLILSDACGAGAHLLRPYFNGFSFETGSVEGLVRALKAMHALKPAQRQAYGKASHQLSKQYTPQRWAETLVKGLLELQSERKAGA
jgi:glycosyltransferase involved in cell wall biosynthesis